jgi:hypothetical protein
MRASDDGVGDVVDRIGGRNLLDEQRPDPVPRETIDERVVTRLVEVDGLVTLDQHVPPLVIREPLCEAGVIHGLLSVQRLAV